MFLLVTVVVSVSWKLIRQTLYRHLKPVICLYTDPPSVYKHITGLYNLVTYLSVQVSLICLFLSLDLDYLLATRTALCNSWRNPFERVMAIPNVGLQSVKLMRQAGDETFEATVPGCKRSEKGCWEETQVLNQNSRLCRSCQNSAQYGNWMSSCWKIRAFKWVQLLFSQILIPCTWIGKVEHTFRLWSTPKHLVHQHQCCTFNHRKKLSGSRRSD